MNSVKLDSGLQIFEGDMPSGIKKKALLPVILREKLPVSDLMHYHLLITKILEKSPSSLIPPQQNS